MKYIISCSFLLQDDRLPRYRRGSKIINRIIGTVHWLRCQRGQLTNHESARTAARNYSQWNCLVRWPAGGADLSARSADNTRPRARTRASASLRLSLRDTPTNLSRACPPSVTRGSTKLDADKHASDNVEKRWGDVFERPSSSLSSH